MAVCRELQKHRVLLDVIQIGTEQDEKLRGISKATGGMCFEPKTLKSALKLLELETLLCAKERVDRPIRKLDSTLDLTMLCWQGPDRCDEESVPQRKQPEELKQPVVPLEQALLRIAETETLAEAGKQTKPVSREHIRAVMRAMRAVQKEPHPAFDVFPSASNMSFWRLVVQGPASSPYAAGTWIMFIRFPPNYPQVAPEVRFVTPIKHCNINCYGRVCHSIFTRNWTADTPILTILNVVYGLLLTPDVQDPLDTALALSHYDGSGDYEGSILTHVQKHANFTREQRRKQLLGEKDKEEEEEEEESEESEEVD